MKFITCNVCERKLPDFQFEHGLLTCKGCRDQVMASRGGVSIQLDETPQPVTEDEPQRSISVDGYTKTQLACVIFQELETLGFPVTYEVDASHINIVGDERTFRLSVSIPRRK
jgi:hypothetical protein